MLFFQGLRFVLYHFFDGTQVFVDGWGGRLGSDFSGRGRGCLDDFSNNRSRLDSSNRCSSGSQFGFLLQALLFTLAATHFTWVVWRAATWRQGTDRGGFDNRCSHFGDNRSFNHRSRLGNNSRGFSDWRWSFDSCSFCNPVERSLLFANFRRLFSNRGFSHRLGSDYWLFGNYSWFYSSVNFRLCFTSWSYFDGRSDWHFDRGSGFHDWRFNLSHFLSSILSHGGSAFSLLMSLGFSRSADHSAGNSGGNGQAGSQFSACWLFAGFGLFRAFDHVAVGIALTLATVAATTLATGAAAWTIAFGVVLAIFLQLLFAGWQLFFSNGGSGLFGTWLTFFTRWAWSALFTWLTSRTLFSSSRYSGGSGWRGIQRFTQFTNRALFTLDRKSVV